jgi:invasion protein IalB
VKTDHRKPAMGRRLESLVMTVVATSCGASAQKMARAATMMAGGPPPSSGSSREASTQWVVGCSKQGQWLGFDI